MSRKRLVVSPEVDTVALSVVMDTADDEVSTFETTYPPLRLSAGQYAAVRRDLAYRFGVDDIFHPIIDRSIIDYITHTSRGV